MSTDSDEVFSDSGRDWHNRALLNYTHEVPWVAYATGYKEAADRLVMGIAEGQYGQDMLVFPILFLYRHYLEISIKMHIRECQKLLGIEPPANPRKRRIQAAKGHDLAALWHYLKDLLPGIYPSLSADVLREIDRVVVTFDRHDEGGDAARYPLDLSEQRTLPGLKAINLRLLAEAMAKAETGFDMISGGIDYAYERRQLDAEYNASR